MSAGVTAPAMVAALAVPARAARRTRRLYGAVNIGVPHLAALVAVVLAVWQGVPLGHLVLTFLLFVLTAAVGIEVGFHRLFSHGAFEARPPLRLALAVLGSMAGQGSVVFWAGGHRHHHAHADRPGDPHSPCLHGSGLRATLLGLWHAHVGWLLDGEDYKTAAGAIDLLRDPVAYGVSRRYALWVGVGLALPAVAGGLLEGSWIGALRGLLWGGFVRMVIGQHVVWSVNSFGHRFGGRRFASKDHSRNNLLLALPTFGGSLHNNHHAFPTAASTSRRWWEPDLCGLVIRAFVLAGLAANAKVPSPEAVQRRALRGGGAA